MLLTQRKNDMMLQEKKKKKKYELDPSKKHSWPSEKKCFESIRIFV